MSLAVTEVSTNCQPFAGYAEMLLQPYAGSDVASLRTTAVRDGDFYIVTGEKKFITRSAALDGTLHLADGVYGLVAVSRPSPSQPLSALAETE